MFKTIVFLLLLHFMNPFFALNHKNRKTNKIPKANQAPILTATGNQFYCVGSPMKIVTDFNIVDTDDTGIDFLYIQISEGYVSGQDLLTITGSHNTISAA